ncbi:hypothetical protein BDW59DRAFT_158903 [Aspergillus cavernicola]|uniref:2-oxoadipate dioxygenase/decarboxylase n=1 Tax=Aspergillus cavernicola TaxID=176166 RepID=A0ABR4IPN9_9EURO
MEHSQDTLRAHFCHALSEMYKAEVPLYGNLVDLVWKADAEAIRTSQNIGLGVEALDPDEVLPPRNRVERHGAIRLGTAEELSTIRRMFAIMGMFPVGYYDLSVAGFPMHATAFRPRGKEALDRHPFRVFTTVLRMELLSGETRGLVEMALQERCIFTERLVELIGEAEGRGDGQLEPGLHEEFIKEGLETFRWHSQSTVTLDEYQILKAEHPLIADIVSFPSCHVNHLTPRTVDIDLVQRMMREDGMPAKERIEGPPRRVCPILLRQTSFKALEETVYFGDERGSFVRGSHTARFGEVEQRGYALTRKGRQLYDRILARVNDEAAEAQADSTRYEEILTKHFEDFPDTMHELWEQKLAYFCYRLDPDTERDLQSLKVRAMNLKQLLEANILEYEPITYEDFLPLSAGGIFNSNLGSTTKAKQLIMDAEADLDGFQRMLGVSVTDEFHLYEQMEQDSLEHCRVRAVLTKSSPLLLYQRIFGIIQPFRHALRISCFLITAWFIACVIISITGCSPVSYFWSRFENQPEPPNQSPVSSPGPVSSGKWLNEVSFFRWNGSANMLLNILMLVLPLPLVWRMRATSKRQKFLLTGIFSIGGFVCVVSLLRIVSFEPAVSLLVA